MRFQTLLTTCFLSIALVSGASYGPKQVVEVETKSLDELYEKLPELYEDWNERMVRSGEASRIRGIAVKFKFNDFQSMTRERVFSGYPTLKDFRELMAEAYGVRSDPIRLLGIGVKLEAASSERTPAGQLKLF